LGGGGGGGPKVATTDCWEIETRIQMLLGGGEVGKRVLPEFEGTARMEGLGTEKKDIGTGMFSERSKS